MLKLKPLLKEATKPNIQTVKAAIVRSYTNHMGTTKGITYVKPFVGEKDIAAKINFPSDQIQVFTPADYKNWISFEKSVEKLLTKYKYQYYFEQGMLKIFKD